MPLGLMKGVIYAFLIVVTGSALTAKMVDNEVIDPKKIGYAVMVILIMASWTAGIISYHNIKRQKLMVCILSGICFYILLLAMTALFFGAQYSGAGETGLLVFGGSLLPIILQTNRKSRKAVRKRKTKNR